MFETLIALTFANPTIPIVEYHLLAQTAQHCDELRIDAVESALARAGVKQATSTACRRRTADQEFEE